MDVLAETPPLTSARPPEAFAQDRTVQAGVREVAFVSHVLGVVLSRFIDAQFQVIAASRIVYKIEHVLS